MAKCKCSDYLFIKGVNENVECTLCNAKFCIAHGGQSDVNHMKKKKHKLAVQNKASNNSISNYLSTKNISELEKQLSLAVQEATFAFLLQCITTASNPWTAQPLSKLIILSSYLYV
jgi:hypothetical protein